MLKSYVLCASVYCTWNKCLLISVYMTLGHVTVDFIWAVGVMQSGNEVITSCLEVNSLHSASYNVDHTYKQVNR